MLGPVSMSRWTGREFSAASGSFGCSVVVLAVSKNPFILATCLYYFTESNN